MIKSKLMALFMVFVFLVSIVPLAVAEGDEVRGEDVVVKVSDSDSSHEDEDDDRILKEEVKIRANLLESEERLRDEALDREEVLKDELSDRERKIARCIEEALERGLEEMKQKDDVV